MRRVACERVDGRCIHCRRPLAEGRKRICTKLHTPLLWISARLATCSRCEHCRGGAIAGRCQLVATATRPGLIIIGASRADVACPLGRWPRRDRLLLSDQSSLPPRDAY